MNSQQLVEIITDAVMGSVRERLPQLIALQVDTRLAQCATPALDRMDGQLADVRAHVQDRITNLQADFAARGIAHADALTASWQQQVDARVAQIVAPAVDKADRALADVRAHVQERITQLQADFATRAIAQADTLTASWQQQVDALQGSIVERVAAAMSGVTSLPGPAGPPGPPGLAGSPGRDATMVCPVHWRLGQTFTRGSIVQHRAGLWFANQDTQAEPGTGVDGYALMFDGGELEAFDYDEHGFQRAIYRYASGITRTVETGFRPMRYAGVYDPGTSYHLNDVVTASGCMWVCKAAQVTGMRPGTDEAARDWQLAVKSGRDGRDGAAGARGDRGERGEQGPPGVTAIRAPKKSNGATP